MLSAKNISVLSLTISYHGYHTRKWLVALPISKGNFCQETLDLLLNRSPAWDNNNKNVIQKVESIQRKAVTFFLNDYDRDTSVSKMIKELNLDSIGLRRKVKQLKRIHTIASQKFFYGMPENKLIQEIESNLN